MIYHWHLRIVEIELSRVSFCFVGHYCAFGVLIIFEINIIKCVASLDRGLGIPAKRRQAIDRLLFMTQWNLEVSRCRKVCIVSRLCNGDYVMNQIRLSIEF